MNRDVTVQEVMDREFVAASESDNALETVALMIREEAEPAVVLRGSEPVGVLSDPRRPRSGGRRRREPDDGQRRRRDDGVGADHHPEHTLAEARDRMAARSTRWLVVSSGRSRTASSPNTTSSAVRPSAPKSTPPTGGSEEDSHLVDASNSTTVSDSGSAEAGGF